MSGRRTARRYATAKQTRDRLAAARAAGIEPGAVEFRPDGAVVVIDRAAIAPPAAPEPALKRLDAANLDAELEAFLGGAV